MRAAETRPHISAVLKVSSSLVCIALTGCAWSQGLFLANLPPPPSDYRHQVAHHIKTTFDDPASVRDAAIAAPRADTAEVPLPNGLSSSHHWVVCVSANAKNLGRYTGRRYYGAVFVNGQLSTMVQAPRWESFCADAEMEPFPEIAGT